MKQSFQVALSLMFLSCLTLCTVMGQTTRISQNPTGSFNEKYTMTSAYGRQYTIEVTLPDSYNRVDKLPVLIYLDAWWLTDLVKGNQTILQMSKKTEPFIMVGISTNGSEDQWHQQRNADFTFSPIGDSTSGIQMKMGTTLATPQNTGNSEAFLKWMVDELIPSMTAKYAMDKNKVSLMGHSLGGLFSLYALMKAPDAFSSCIMISPALWWDNMNLISDEGNKSQLVRLKDKNIFLSYGDNEHGLIQKPSEVFDDQLDSLGVKHRTRVYQKANHNSVLSRAIYDGLEWMYSIE